MLKCTKLSTFLFHNCGMGTLSSHTRQNGPFGSLQGLYDCKYIDFDHPDVIGCNADNEMQAPICISIVRVSNNSQLSLMACLCVRSTMVCSSLVHQLSHFWAALILAVLMCGYQQYHAQMKPAKHTLTSRPIDQQLMRYAVLS